MLVDRLLQALIEMTLARLEERAILKSLSSHVSSRADIAPPREAEFYMETPP